MRYLVTIGIIVLVIGCYISCKKSAQVINQSLGTHYSTSDYFWAGDTMEKINKSVKLTN